MSDNNDFEFDIDSILAEFTSYEPDAAETAEAEAKKPEPVSYAPVYSQPENKHERPEPGTRKYETIAPEPADEEPYEEEENADGDAEREHPRGGYGRERRSRYDDEEDDFYDDEEDDRIPLRDNRTVKNTFHSFLGIIFAVLSVFVLAFTTIKVHPDAVTAVSTAERSKIDLSTRIDTFANNTKADALSHVAVIRKTYKIPENDHVAPMPNRANYGVISYDNTDEVLALYQKARESGLLGEDEAVVFDPNAEFFTRDTNGIMYYYDETILVVLWKELIEGRICSNAEVKIADASQFRRKLAEDSYQTTVQYNCSELAKSANAVVAMNADFFAFRDFGITVYERKVYRDNPALIDTCYITGSGDMIYSYKGELSTPEEAQAFVDNNDVLFSLAFGPILVNDGQAVRCDSYPMGEIEKEYSRAGIGMVDKLHYLYMTVNHYVDGGFPRCNVNEFAQIFASQNVRTAYNLDGGQTSEINFQGEMFNRVDWGSERVVSDIIYFATALPEGEG